MFYIWSCGVPTYNFLFELFLLLNTCIKLLAFGCSYFDWDLCSSKWKQHSLKHKYKNIHVSTNLPWTNRHKNFIWYFALYHRSFFSSDTKVIWLQNCHSLNVRWDCVMSVVQEKKRCGVSQVLTLFLLLFNLSFKFPNIMWYKEFPASPGDQIYKFYDKKTLLFL